MMSFGSNVSIFLNLENLSWTLQCLQHRSRNWIFITAFSSLLLNPFNMIMDITAKHSKNEIPLLPICNRYLLFFSEEEV